MAQDYNIATLLQRTTTGARAVKLAFLGYSYLVRINNLCTCTSTILMYVAICQLCKASKSPLPARLSSTTGGVWISRRLSLPLAIVSVGVTVWTFGGNMPRSLKPKQTSLPLLHGQSLLRVDQKLLAAIQHQAAPKYSKILKVSKIWSISASSFRTAFSS